MSLTFIGRVGASRTGAVHSATDVAIGTASSNRRVICFIAGGTAGGRPIVSGVIGGVDDDAFGSGSGNGCITGYVSAVVPTGTTADISVTLSNDDFFTVDFLVYTVENDEFDISEAVTATDTSASSTELTFDYTAAAGATTAIVMGSTNGGGKGSIDSPTSPWVIDRSGTFGSVSLAVSLDEETAGAKSVLFDWGGSDIPSSGFALSIPPFPAGGAAAITGTATTGMTETDVIAGGKTIIITLTGDTWIEN
jgi:hypothetical protein